MSWYLSQSSKLRQSFGISDDDLKQIKAFLQGCVYCWVKNRKDEVFAARDIVGGENYQWEGTPLIALYSKHISLGKRFDGMSEGLSDQIVYRIKT